MSKKGGIFILETQADSVLSVIPAFLQHGLAIEPILVKNVGEMSKLVLEKECKIIPCTTQRFIKELCRYLFLDFKSLQKYVKEKIYKTQMLPIPLTHQLVLFPLRMMQESDVATRGFIWIGHRKMKEFKCCQGKQNSCEILLTNDYRVKVPYSFQFIHQQMRDACLIGYMFQEAHQFLNPFGPTMNEDPKALHQQLMKIAEAIKKYPS